MRYLLATGLVVGLTLAVAGAAFAREVGDVQAVERDAFGTPPDAAKEAKRAGDPVAFKELLETLAQSGLLVRFSDGSKLTLGARSKVLVDDFVYDPSNPASKALISLPQGRLRYVTGSMPKGQTTIDTPTATMVLRGTNVQVYSTGNDTLLHVEEGSVTVYSKQTGQQTLVKQGQSVVIGADGIASTSQDKTGDPLVDGGFTGNTGRNDPGKPLSDGAVNGLLKRLGYRGRQTNHGFRHLVSTALNEQGYDSDWVERQLAHGDPDKIRGTYNNAMYLTDRSEMMQAWADFLDVARSGATTIPFKRKVKPRVEQDAAVS